MPKAILLLPAALALQACVYSSPVPLADPADAIFDEALTGAWLPLDVAGELITAADTQAALVHVTRDTGNTYRVTHRVEGNDEEDRAYVVALDGVRILTMVERNGDEVVYSFARYTIEGDRLMLRFIADRGAGEERGIESTYATTAELQAAVRARLHDPLLYEEEEVVLVRRSAQPDRR